MRKTVIDLIRGQVVKGLVKPIPVITVAPMPESVPQLESVAKRVRVNVAP